MVPTSQLFSVPPSAIDLDDRTYCLLHWDDPMNNDLVSSIKQFGILHPPFLQQKSNNSFRIIAGRKRLTTIRHLDPAIPVLCHIFPAETKKTDIFSLILEEAKTGRPLSIVEQVVFFDKLLKESPEKEAIHFLAQLGQKPQKHILYDLLKLRSLSEPVLKSIHSGILQVKNGRKLLDLSEADQKLIVNLITSLHLGGSKQRKLIDLCKELIYRKDSPLKNILSDFQESQEHEQPENLPQHATALLSWLEGQCSPRLSQTENNFKRQVASLNLPPSMKISHAKAFEDDEITLSLRFSDWQSLGKMLEEIKNLMLENKSDS